MLRWSIATVCMGGALEGKLAAAAKAGFRAVEIFENDLTFFSGKPNEARRMAADLGLEIVALQPMRRDQGWCEDPASGHYNRPVRLPAADGTDRMRRDDDLYDLVFVLDHNFTRRCKGRGSAIFLHLARPGLTPTAGCVSISAADMRKLAPRLAKGAELRIG